MTKVQKNLE